MKYQSVDEVLSFVKNNLDVTVSLHAEKDKTIASRKLQHYFSMRPFSGENKIRYESLLSYASTAEKLAPGAGIKFLSKVSESAVNGFHSVVNNNNNNDRSSILDKLQNSGFDHDIFHMLVEALEHANTQTTFMIKVSNSSKSYMEYSEGYKFKVKSLIDLKRTFEFKKPKVVTIDGYVESVAEAHHLFQFLSENSETCVFLCRGMSEDVKHTIKINLDRGILKMVPYVVPFDLEFCNTMVDVAVVAGGDVVSSTKGQLISNMNLFDIPSVEKCECTREFLVISNKNTKSEVKAHVDRLKSKIEGRLELEEVLSKRLSSLTSSYFEFRIPLDMSYNLKRQQLDEGIRIISTSVGKKTDVDSMINDLVKSYKRLTTDVIVSGGSLG